MVAAARTPDPLKRRKYLTFVVSGGGFTGVEMIGELILWRRRLSQEYNIPLSEIRLVLVEALDAILPHIDAKLADKVLAYLDAHHVQVFTGQRITAVEPDRITLGDNLEIETKTLIWAGGVMANQVVQNSGLPQRGRGRLQVNQYLQVEGYPEVFAAGDNCGLTWEEEGRQVLMPALVESALATGKTAATNIIASLAGKPCAHRARHGLMVSVGVGGSCRHHGLVGGF